MYQRQNLRIKDVLCQQSLQLNKAPEDGLIRRTKTNII